MKSQTNTPIWVLGTRRNLSLTTAYDYYEKGYRTILTLLAVQQAQASDMQDYGTEFAE
jgi:hypothetical protein